MKFSNKQIATVYYGNQCGAKVTLSICSLSAEWYLASTSSQTYATHVLGIAKRNILDIELNWIERQ